MAFNQNEAVPAIAVDILYFAVYPGGRRCAVTQADVEAFGAKWEQDDGVKIETDIVQKFQPVYGKMNFWPV